MGKRKRARDKAAEAQLYDYPLSENSEELRALLAGWIAVGSNGLEGVNEHTAFSIPAFARGVELIASTIATLPLKTYSGEGAQRREVPSVFDDPTGPYEITPYGWVETVVMHLVCYREAYLLQLRNGAGALVGYFPIHPGTVTKVAWEGPSKRYHVTNGTGGTKIYGTPDDPTDDGAIRQILGPSTASLRGRPLWESHRRTFQIAIAAEKASARTFTGALIGGLVTPNDEDVPDAEESKLILEHLNSKVSGVENAGRLAFINRNLKMTSWQMSNLDAQFNESQAFVIEQFARMLGLMPIHIGQTDKQTSWGTGVAEQNLGLARYCLMSYTSRIESALSLDLPFPEFVEFDYKGLLQGTPKDEIELLLSEAGLAAGQPGVGLIDINEARAVINYPPIDLTQVQQLQSTIPGVGNGGPANG